MVNPIPNSVRKVWDEWNMRGVILFSMTLQIILTLFAPMRKNTKSKLVTTLLWSVYLMADVAAVFALGLISDDVKGEDNQHQHSIALIASWPPFLILHLAGPVNITAFALEDNDLWLRHLVALLVQLLAAAYIFLLSLPQTKLAIPTILVLVAATIKYVERTRAFYLASFDGFLDLVSEDVRSSKRWFISDKSVNYSNQFQGLKAIRLAYRDWRIYQGIIVNRIYTHTRVTRRDILDRTPEEEYMIIEAELNFIYDVLYTKVQVASSRAGVIAYLVSLCCVVAAFSIFHFKVQVKEHGFNEFDVGVTYALFFGAVTIDLVTLFTLVSFDLSLAALASWNVKKIDSSQWVLKSQSLEKVINWILNLKQSNWYKCECEDYNHNHNHNHKVLSTRFLFGRWSGKVPRFNILSYCLRRRPTRLHHHQNNHYISKLSVVFGNIIHHLTYYICNLIVCFLRIRILTEFLDRARYVCQEPLTNDVWDFIFNELREKYEAAAADPETAKQIYSSRGEYILGKTDGCNQLLQFVSDNDYAYNIEEWHMATEIHYQTDRDDGGSGYRSISKILSDYMFYLLILQPSVMSSIAGNSREFFPGLRNTVIRSIVDKNLQGKSEKEAYTALNYKVRDDEVPKVSEYFSGLDDPNNKERKWEIMSKVWVEMLSYAAVNAGSRIHCQQVNTGGELVTFVWLLMNHCQLTPLIIPDKQP